MNILVRSVLCTKRVIESYRLNGEAFEWLMGEIEARFIQAMVSFDEIWKYSTVRHQCPVAILDTSPKLIFSSNFCEISFVNNIHSSSWISWKFCTEHFHALCKISKWLGNWEHGRNNITWDLSFKKSFCVIILYGNSLIAPYIARHDIVWHTCRCMWSRIECQHVPIISVPSNDIDGLMQTRHNSNALAMEFCLFCIKPSI